MERGGSGNGKIRGMKEFLPPAACGGGVRARSGRGGWRDDYDWRYSSTPQKFAGANFTPPPQAAEGEITGRERGAGMGSLFNCLLSAPYFHSPRSPIPANAGISLPRGIKGQVSGVGRWGLGRERRFRGRPRSLCRCERPRWSDRSGCRRRAGLRRRRSAHSRPHGRLQRRGRETTPTGWNLRVFGRPGLL